MVIAMPNAFMVVIDSWQAAEYATREAAEAKRDQLQAQYPKSFITVIDTRLPAPQSLTSAR
jgi:hypothetical protein